jgi:hypothetical protein
MLRRIPSTPLVCLVLFMSTCLMAPAWAAGPDESLEILLKPNQGNTSPALSVPKARAKLRTGAPTMPQASIMMLPPPPPGISKVKAPAWCAPASYRPDCILPQTQPGQWEMSAQIFYGRIHGQLTWPRYSIYTAWYNNVDVDLNDALGVPKHQAFVQFSAKYQFRPNWAVRYSVLGAELNGSTGWNYNNAGYLQYFGNIPLYTGNPIQSQWQHTYQRLGLIYDAVKTCKSTVSVFADWVHTDDKMNVNCAWCGYYTNTFSKGGDSAIVGLEYQQCLKTAANGGALSLDLKGGAIFLDDVEGADIQAGARYSIPLNCGRSGYVKGGYRYVELKKTQYDFVFNNAIDGGFLEFGFIF